MTSGTEVAVCYWAARVAEPCFQGPLVCGLSWVWGPCPQGVGKTSHSA